MSSTPSCTKKKTRKDNSFTLNMNAQPLSDPQPQKRKAPPSATGDVPPTNKMEKEQELNGLRAEVEAAKKAVEDLIRIATMKQLLLTLHEVVTTSAADLRKLGYIPVFFWMLRAGEDHGLIATLHDVICTYLANIKSGNVSDLASIYDDAAKEEEEGEPIALTKEEWLHPTPLVLLMLKVVGASSYGCW